MFLIEDELHAEEQHGRYESFADAVAELRRRAALPWDQPPNQAPCKNWRDCGRCYEIIEYDESAEPWAELQRVHALDVSAAGAMWRIPHNA